MENLRVLEGSEVFFRGLQHLYPRFKSGWRLASLGFQPRLFLLHKSRLLGKEKRIDETQKGEYTYKQQLNMVP